MLDGIEATEASSGNEVSNAVEPKETVKDSGDQQAAKPEQKELSESDKIKAAMQKRIDNVIKSRHELQRKYDQLIAEGKKNGSEGQSVKDDGAPKEADYKSYEEFLIAKGKYEAKQEFDKQEKERAAREKGERDAAELAAKNKEFLEKEAEFRKTTPDYDEAVGVLNEAIQIVNHNSGGFQAFREVMLSTEDLPALSYYLGKNPEIIESMMTMRPVEVARTLFKAEIDAAKFKKTEAKTALPSPIKPVGGKGKSDKSLSDMSGKELLAWMKSK